MPYRRPLIEKINYPVPIPINYDKNEFTRNDLNLLANHFVETHRLKKIYKELNRDDYNKIIEIFSEKNSEYGTILMDAEIFLLEGNAATRQYSNDIMLGFEAVASIESNRNTEPENNINDITGVLRVFSKNGNPKLKEKIPNVKAIWDNNLKGWIAALGINNLFIKILPRPIMGFYMYDLF